MKTKPIIFKAEMVRAILAGEKTQTRRIIKPIKEVCGYKGNKYIDGEPPSYPITGVIGDSLGTEYWNFYVGNLEGLVKCPYGKIGDKLWVRENFYVLPYIWAQHHNEQPIHYSADVVNKQHIEDYVQKPSIHMPRWASRITLEITNIRVERIQDISEDDAKAEGVEFCYSQELIDARPEFGPTPEASGYKNYLWHGVIGSCCYSGNAQTDAWAHQYSNYRSAKGSFSSLWEKINGPRGFGWDKNPWVWVIEFKKI